MNYTEEQRLIIDLRMNAGEVRKVVAGSGAGKTSTFRGYCNERLERAILYIAFNKAIQLEAERTFPKNTTCKTGHALAFQEIGRSYCRGDEGGIASSIGLRPICIHCRVNIKTAAEIRNSLNCFLSSADPAPGIQHVKFDPKKTKMLEEAEDSMPGINEMKRREIVEHVASVWNTMVNRESKFLPMTHDGYLKLFQLSKPTLAGQILLVDEAQDLSPAMMDIVLSQTGKRIILCGDPFQQIYSWRGAVDALQKVDCEPLFLSQSFRFGSKIADLANLILGSFFEDPGKKLRGNPQVTSTISLEVPHDVFPRTVICRTNSGAIGAIIEAVLKGIPFFFNGDLRLLVEQVFDGLNLKRRQRHLIQPKSKMLAFADYEELKSVAEIDAELGPIVSIIEKHAEDLLRIQKEMWRLHVEKSEWADITVTTAHRAKGLEWDAVQLGGDFPCLVDSFGDPLPLLEPNEEPSPDKINPEEINLLYVAATRAKRLLGTGSSLNSLIHGIPAEPKPERNLEKEYESARY